MNEATKKPRIAVIGAGMSGIAAVIKLRKAGYDDLTVYEKSDRVGGTWRDNSYPGLSCDVPSHWYSYTFEPNPDWSHRFSYGPEIQAYFERVAEKYDVLRDVRFQCPVTELRWLGDEGDPRWRLTTAAGEVELYDVVLGATGILHHPSVPNIPGLDDFAGAKFHSARWDHAVDLAGKRVGVIGTGSTASQIVGATAKEVGHLSVFQRTPQWMVPLNQTEYSSFFRMLCRRVPGFTTLLYWWHYLTIGTVFAGATLRDGVYRRLVTWYAQKHLKTAITDPELRAQLTPDYKPACKRLILCSSFYDAIVQPHVDLVTAAIERIEAGGIRTADGAFHELDVLVLATGFHSSKFILPTKVLGEGGIELGDFWQGAPRAHRSVAIPGFPNYWMIEGPTGPVGNLSLVTITELQIDYVIDFLDRMTAENLAAITPKREAYDAYNAAMAEAVTDTIWVTGGCDSWYKDASGLPNLYPWPPSRFRREMRRPDPSEYRLIAHVAAERSQAAA